LYCKLKSRPENSKIGQLPSRATEQQTKRKMSYIYNAEDFEWKEIESESKAVVEGDSFTVECDKRGELEENSSKSWDIFYQKNKNKFFNERHYLDKEFAELSLSDGKQKIVMEVGCGSGSTTLPLITTNKDLFFYSLDCSVTAIDLLKIHKDYDSNKCTALACDVVVDEIPDVIPDNSVDFCIMTFFLSALPPEKMGIVVKKIYNKLKVGGMVLFRDYGLYDMAMLRFAKDKGHKICDNLYTRSDGTLAYYFSIDFLKQLFAEGFSVEELKYVTSKVKNAARRITMNRIWIHGKFKKCVPNKN